MLGEIMKKTDVLTWLFVSAVLAITGCSTQRAMMPTPNVHLEAENDYFSEVPSALKNTEVPLFYITDRAPEQEADESPKYGYGRSESMAFGKAVVDLGSEISWDELLEASRTQSRIKPVELKMKSIQEIARSPAIPTPYRVVNGRIVEKPEFTEARKATINTFGKTLRQQLALTPRKEVFIYVHGYHNTFEDAAFAMAELWHFLGRIGVPIVYTWPAGHPGLFGYTYDRESSEFTVIHLRRVLKLIASYPEVEKIHLIGHSRGTDVVLDAVREISIEARAKGQDPKRVYKLSNIILAAPDLDLQVATQRIVGDRIAASTDRFTIYTSPNDKAISVAGRLFASPRGRLGTFGLEDVSGSAKEVLEYGNTNLDVITFEGASGSSRSVGDRAGHSYFRNAPTVASDVVLILRENADAGSPERPLIKTGPHFYAVPGNYP